jgi:septal ring factor EnvC (AmiA/AmiB activator)
VERLPVPDRPRRIHGVTDAPRPRLPWLLVAAGVLLTGLLAYTLFGGYLPAKQRVASLERELHQLYRREAELQTRVAQDEQRHAVREQHLTAVSAERDALARRLADVERQLAAARGRKR